MASKLKEGPVLRYSSSVFNPKWKKNYAMLLSDSRLIWFENGGDQRAKGSVVLRNVIPYICVGFMTDRMPVKRPNIPHGYSINHLVGIGTNAKANPVHWFLFSSDSDIESWFAEITKTFPKPPNLPNLPAPPVQQGNYAPPPYQRPSGPYQGSYPSNNPVIVRDQRSTGPFGGGGFGTGGLGLGSGLLAGSLLGYGLGSMFNGGHRGFGGGPGYFSDNDTNITNNYYNYGDGGPGNFGGTDQSNDYGNANESSSSWDQGGNDYGNANLGDFGGGMDYGSGGLSDFGGGDFGGGGFD